MKPYTGLLVVFDGIDGAGKTTQALRLAKDLTAVGENVLLSKEPTDGAFGAKLRASALTGRLPFEEELELFISDRQQHLKDKVVPALESGNIVILDRYFYSTLAYQGARAGTLIGIEGRIRQDVIHPDITFWIDTPPKVAVSRIENRDGAANHFERLDDLIAIDTIFRKISVHEKNMICIDGSRPVNEVYESVMRLFVDGPFQRKRCAKSYGCEDHIYCTPRLTNTCEWWQKATKLKNLA